MGYENFKKFVVDHRTQLTTLLACTVMFVVGLGTGKTLGRQPNANIVPPPADYSAKTEVKPDAERDNVNKSPLKAAPVPHETEVPTPAPEASNKPVPGQPCIVKGNISGSNKIYHVKGGASYEKTTPEACFNTEAEAVAAGFRKAKR